MQARQGGLRPLVNLDYYYVKLHSFQYSCGLKLLILFLALSKLFLNFPTVFKCTYTTPLLQLLLPVRSMRQGYAFVSVYMCVCVWTKNTLVYVSPLEIRHKSALCSFFTEYIVL